MQKAQIIKSVFNAPPPQLDGTGLLMPLHPHPFESRHVPIAHAPMARATGTCARR